MRQKAIATFVGAEYRAVLDISQPIFRPKTMNMKAKKEKSILVLAGLSRTKNLSELRFDGKSELWNLAIDRLPRLIPDLALLLERLLSGVLNPEIHSKVDRGSSEIPREGFERIAQLRWQPDSMLIEETEVRRDGVDGACVLRFPVRVSPLSQRSKFRHLPIRSHKQLVEFREDFGALFVQLRKAYLVFDRNPLKVSLELRDVPLENS
jgi:hypothetical protein